MEYLQQLAAEWFEYRGYFVHRDLWVGLEADGSYECELDVVAYHPLRRHLLHIESSFDLLAWADKEQYFRTKFEAGRKYLHRMFGAEAQVHLEQIALIAAASESPRTVAGARVVALGDFFAEILHVLCSFDSSESAVPPQWPLVLTLQFVAAYRSTLAQVLAHADSQPRADP